MRQSKLIKGITKKKSNEKAAIIPIQKLDLFTKYNKSQLNQHVQNHLSSSRPCVMTSVI